MSTPAPRPLGTWSAIALVAGSMIGSGVFLLPSSLAPFGVVSLHAWAVTLGGALLLALTFARLAARSPAAGGPYAYVRAAFGDTAGFVVAWSYWVSMWCANAAIATAFAGSLGGLFPDLVATPMRSAGVALGALWLCTVVNLAGVREAGIVQVVTTVLKVVPLLVFGGIAIWWLEPRLFATTPDAIAAAAAGGAPATYAGALHAAVALTLWAFLGLEAATVPAGAIRDAERVIPRATLIGTLIAGVATILACTAELGILAPEAAKASGAPMADAARALWGPAAGHAIALVAAVSCLGALNGWVLLSAQLPMAAAQDGLFPRKFGRVDARGTPRFAVLVGAVLATLLVGANYTDRLTDVFTFAILLSTAATLLPYVASSAASLRLNPGGRIVAALALAYSAYTLLGTGTEALTWGALLVAAGLPFYAWQVWRNRR